MPLLHLHCFQHHHLPQRSKRWGQAGRASRFTGSQSDKPVGQHHCRPTYTDRLLLWTQSLVARHTVRSFARILRFVPWDYLGVTIRYTRLMSSAVRRKRGLIACWVDGKLQLISSLYRVAYARACKVGALVEASRTIWMSLPRGRGHFSAIGRRTLSKSQADSYYLFN